MVKNTSDTSYKETIFGILPRSKTIQLEVKGVKIGMTELVQLALENTKLDLGLIKQIHKISFSDILRDKAGVFRLVQVVYSGKEAPNFTQVPVLMQNLCDDTEFQISHLPNINSNDFIIKVLKILAYFQHRFVVIHPFVDYNGRMSRMLTNFILMRLELPLIEISVTQETERKEYISALQSADNGNYQILEDIISTAINESLINIKDK